MHEFIKNINVSHETSENFEIYIAELLRWNEKINLIGDSTAANVIERHIMDCAQLEPLINKESRVLDIGSGAGMPGIVLSLLGFNVTLVEKSFKKFQFLCRIKSLLKLQAKILNLRLEKNMNIGDFDVITCRAFADLSDIISLTEHYFDRNVKYILPKGESYQNEIDNASDRYQFDYKLVDSVTGKSSKIIILNKK